LNASRTEGYDKAGSTPPVVPGAAPALAKAGVGGFSLNFMCRCVGAALQERRNHDVPLEAKVTHAMRSKRGVCCGAL